MATPNKFFILFHLFVVTHCFHVDKRNPCIQRSSNVSSRRQNSVLQSKLFGDEAVFDDESGRDVEKSRKEGEDLAKNFYKEMKKREAQDEDKSAISKASTSLEKGRSDTLDPRQLLEEDKKSEIDATSPGTKFTGKSSQPSPERFMSNSGRSITAGPGVRTPREVMMEREYQLVGRAEKGLVVQGIFAVIALTFYIYVGISGGITNRSQESLENFGGDDMLPFEQLVPLQTDRETSVWL